MAPNGGKALGTFGTLALVVVVVAWRVLGGPPAASSQPPRPTDSTPPASPATPPAKPDAAPIDTSRAPEKAKPKPADKTIKIGAWNIEWLGKPEERSGAAKNIAQSPTDLAGVIVDSGVSMLALEEIVTRVKGTPIRSREIESTLAEVKKRTGDSWEYVLFPGRAEGDQLTGIAWDTKAVTAVNLKDAPWDQTKDEPYRVPIKSGRSSQGSSLWNRPPHAMKFSLGTGKTDFVAIVLHMKADYNGDFAQHRKEEAEALAAALPEVKRATKDQDIVLLGDSNCTGDHEPAIAAFEKSDFIDLNSKLLPTHWRGGTMDRVLSPKSQPEFASHKFDVIGEAYLRRRAMDPRDYKKRFSDHFMVVSEIAVMPDDD